MLAWILGIERCKKVVGIKEKEILANPYSMFVYAIKSPLTRKKYEGRLAKFFDFSGIAGEALEAVVQHLSRRVGCIRLAKALAARNSIDVIRSTFFRELISR